MMRTIRISAFTSCALAIAATAVSAQPVDTVVAANYAPLMIEDGGERPGYAIEVLREAARRTGRQVNITFMPFERAMLALRDNADIIMPALFYGKKHNNQFRWVVEIQSARLRFATLTSPVNSLDAARQLGSIVVESGTTADAMLTELGFDNLVRTVDPESSSLMLAAGRVDAWYQSGGTMRQFWARLAIADPLVTGEVMREVPIFLVASTALPDDVANGYRDAVEGMRADGTLAALFQLYVPD